MGTALLRHRRALLALFALAAVVAALGLPRLEQDLDPRALVPGARSQPARVAFLFRAAPGEALADARLAASHRVARALASRPEVQRVDAPTTTPIPHVPVARGLAALEEDAEGDDAPGLDTLAALVEAAPERFPGGLSALGERLGGALVVAPLVRGPAPSPDELARAREVLGTPALRGGPVGRSGASLLVVATLAPDADAAAVVRVAEEAAGDVRVEATGAPLLEAALKAQLARDPELVAALAALGNFLVLFLGFRRQAGVALPMLAAGASVLLVLGTLGWLGHPITLLSIIVPPLLLTVAVGDAVHLVGRYAEERALGRDADAAAARTHEAMTRACFATSLTTALGLASLAWAELPALRDFALVGAAGVLVAYLVTVGLLPLLLPIAGRAPRPARGELGLAGWALAHPWRALGASAVVLVAALFAALGVRAETRLLEPFPADEPLVERADFLAREHGGLRRLTLTLPVDPATPAGLAEVRALRAELASEPGVARVAGPDALLDAAWATLAEGPLPEDRATLRALAGLLSALPTWRDATAEGATLEVGLADVPAERLVALGERLGTRHGARPGGEAWRTSHALTALGRELAVGFALALGLILLVIAVLGRSLRAGLASLPPNLLPLELVLGWMGLRGIPFTASTAMVFAVCLGLAVDGTIHVLVRYREERGRREDPRIAAVTTMRESGRGVRLGGFTLLAGFAALLASAFPPIATFAELSLVAIAGALLAELVLMPAMLRLVVR